MYKDQGNRMTWLAWRESISVGLGTLFHGDFEEQEYVAITNCWRQQGDKIAYQGAGPFMTKSLNVRFLCTAALLVPVFNVHDIWQFQVDADIKGIAVNNGQLERTAIERLVYGNEKIEGVAETVKIPAALLSDFQNARAACAGFLGDQPLTLDKMIRKLSEKKVYKSLCSINRSWVLEHTWMVAHSATLLATKVESRIIASIERPQEISKIKYSKVFDAIAVAQTSAEVAALPLDVAKTLAGVQDMIESIKTGEAPGDKSVKKFSAFHTRVLQACEQWCTARVPQKGGAATQHVICHGRDALDWIWMQAEGSADDKGVANMQYVGHLRRFLWMLSVPQQERVNAWAKGGMKAYRQRLAVGMICDAPASTAPKGNGALTGAEGVQENGFGSSDVGGSSSSAACAAEQEYIDLPKASAPPKQKRKVSGGEVDMKTAMASLFGSKAKIK